MLFFWLFAKKIVDTRIFNVRLIHAFAFSKWLCWFESTKTNVNTLKTQTHLVNTRWKRMRQLGFCKIKQLYSLQRKIFSVFIDSSNEPWQRSKNSSIAKKVFLFFSLSRRSLHEETFAKNINSQFANLEILSRGSLPHAFSTCVYCMLFIFHINYFGWRNYCVNANACCKRTLKTRVATRLTWYIKMHIYLSQFIIEHLCQTL